MNNDVLPDPTTPTPQQAVTALLCIFCGGLLCLFDITHSSLSRTVMGVSGWRFDFLSDTVGVLLILAGFRTLRKFNIDGTYDRNLLACSFVAGLSLIDTVQAHWVADRPEAVRTLLSVLGLARLAAVMLFCTAMIDLACAVGMPAAADSFRRTRWLFALLYVVPMAIFYALHFLILAGVDVSFSLSGGWALLVLCVMAFPLIHFFVSTRRLNDAFKQKQSVQSFG